MTTICSCCGEALDESKAKGRFVSCIYCHKYTPLGANSFKDKIKISYKGGIKMELKKKPKSENSGGQKAICSKCGKAKGVRPDVYEARVKKFGGVQKMLDNYLCRDCRPKTEKKAKQK